MVGINGRFEVGVVLPNYGPRASVDEVRRMAEVAEELD